MQLVVLVFAYCMMFGVEFTLFGRMLVVGATVMISRSGFCLLYDVWHRVHSLRWNACCYCGYYNESCWFLGFVAF